MFGLIFASFLILSMSFSFVAADSHQSFVDETSDFVRDAIDLITTGVFGPIFEFLLGTTDTGGGFVVKALLIVLTITIIMAVLQTIPTFEGKTWTKFLIGLVIAVLGTRFIPDGFVEQIVAPSTALVAIFALGIPFVIFFYVLEKVSSPNLRRAGWAIFGALIFVLWLYNLSDPDIPRSAKWLYPLFAFACALAFWFDGTLQKFIRGAKAKREISTDTLDKIEAIKAELALTIDSLAAATTKAQRQALQRRIESKKAALAELNKDV